MPDVLSQGGGREPGPWPRRVAAIVVLVLAGVVIVLHLPRSRDGAARPAPAATVTVSAASGAVVPAAGLAAVPDGISGAALSWPSDLRLPAAGQQPAWFSPGTGQVVPIGGLPAQRSGYQFIRAAGGWAVQASPDVRAGCGACAGPPRAVYFLADHAQSVTPVGLADTVAPGAAGALWLTSYPPDADRGTAVGTAREVSITGRPLGPQLRLPAGYLIEQATDRGLLLAPVAPRPGATAYLLWNPAAPQASRAFAAVIAASPSQIAWAPPCAARCGVLVLNLATGRQVTATLPSGRSAATAAFSPDGRFLAVEVSFSSEADDGGQALQLELESTASGRLMAVPGTSLSSDALISFGWPASSDSLVAELGFTTKVQLTSWRPGASRLAVAQLRPQQSPASLVIGQYAT
ncbi:MAG: hypothetical protein ACRDP5_27540 [Streptosporangiaceae bacterium]